MGHAITVWDVLVVCGAAATGILVIGGLVLLLTIMNPFRSGH